MSQTVSFQCGHCHKVMGVTSAYLGKQVRCPHCQQVVMAPAQAPAPPAQAPVPAPTLTAPAPAPAPKQPSAPVLNFSAGPPNRDEHESIFGEQVADDLFDAAPKPKIELPPEAPRPSLQLEPTVFQMPSLPPTVTLPSSPDSGPTMTVPSPVQVAPPPVNNVPPPLVSNDWPSGSTSVAGSDGAAQMSAPVARVPTRPADTTSTTLMWYILYLLAGYSLLMTIIALYYFTQAGKAPHPMEILPDPSDSKSKSLTSVIERIRPTTELPDRLKLSLGQTLTLGDLEVTPLKVEQKLIRYDYRTGMNSYAAEHESLVLHLKLKNVSKNTVFRPTDCSFDYEWKEEKDSGKLNLPYTHLSANGHYYAGPIPWRPGAPGTLYKPKENLRNEYIEGQKDDERVLKPDEEVETVIATDPKDKVPDNLRDSNFKDKMEWRVQLRRGFVPYDGKNISCTAVIGVIFDMSQVEKK